jgi:hypothetical protein
VIVSTPKPVDSTPPEVGPMVAAEPSARPHVGSPWSARNLEFIPSAPLLSLRENHRTAETTKVDRKRTRILEILADPEVDWETIIQPLGDERPLSQSLTRSASSGESPHPIQPANSTGSPIPNRGDLRASTDAHPDAHPGTDTDAQWAPLHFESEGIGGHRAERTAPFDDGEAISVVPPRSGTDPTSWPSPSPGSEQQFDQHSAA